MPRKDIWAELDLIKYRLWRIEMLGALLIGLSGYNALAVFLG